MSIPTVATFTGYVFSEHSVRLLQRIILVVAASIFTAKRRFQIAPISIGYRRVHGVRRPTAAHTNGCLSGRLTPFVSLEFLSYILRDSL